MADIVTKFAADVFSDDLRFNEVGTEILFECLMQLREFKLMHHPASEEGYRRLVNLIEFLEESIKLANPELAEKL